MKFDFSIAFFLQNQRRWIAALSSEYPTLAFHASVQNPFGKGALIQLLRQFGKVQLFKHRFFYTLTVLLTLIKRASNSSFHTLNFGFFLPIKFPSFFPLFFFIRSLVRSLAFHWFIYQSIYSLIRLFMCSFVCSFVLSSLLPFLPFFVRSYVPSFFYFFDHFCIYLFGWHCNVFINNCLLSL